MPAIVVIILAFVVLSISTTPSIEPGIATIAHRKIILQNLICQIPIVSLAREMGFKFSFLILLMRGSPFFLGALFCLLLMGGY